MRFDFHKYCTFRECPRKYDFGVRDVPPLVKDNRYYAVYGQLIQKFFELYSNKHIPLRVPLDRQGISKFLRPFYDNLLYYNHVDWKAPLSKMNEQEFFEDVVEVILANLQKLDIYRDGMRSELKIEVTLKGGDVLVSKIDFEKTLAPKSIHLLDGKSTATIGKNVEPGQLLFYAGMYQAKYRILPEELAFVYYKHQVMERIPFDASDVKYLIQDVLGTLRVVKETKVFAPKPSAKACRYCSWLSQCPEGKADMDSRKRGPRKAKDLGLPEGKEFFDITL